MIYYLMSFGSDNADLENLFRGMLDDFMSLEGFGGIQNRKYITLRNCQEICKRLDERTGSYVKRLAVPNFLSIEDIQPYAIYCQNIEYLDLDSFMHNIDQDVRRPERSFSPST